jgi:hypothetical protein
MATRSPAGFKIQGQQAVEMVRSAIAEVLAAASAPVSLPQELSRRFGLDKMLTWRLSRVVCAQSAWEAMEHIPRRPSIEIFANAMKKHGVEGGLIEKLWKAVEEFERFTSVHAGDRETLDIMASVTEDHVSERRLEQFRKNGYAANSALWGVSTRLQLALRMIAPTATNPEMLDVLTICGFADFRRLRGNVNWTVSTLRSWQQDESAAQTPVAVPLEPRPDGDGIPLLTRFSSRPIPEMHATKEHDGSTRFVLNAGPVGLLASATIMLGWVDNECVSVHRAYPTEAGEHGSHLSTPAELLVHDFFVHESLGFAMNPEVRVYGQLPGGPRYPSSNEADAELPVAAGIRPIERDEWCEDVELENYEELLAFGAAKLGRSIGEFRGFRFALRYPPIPAISVIKHELLPPQ